jgi:hypothetical protein
MAGSIYDKPTKQLMREFADAQLSKDQPFTRQDVITWFAHHYPKIKSATVGAHCEGMSVNSENRKHHPSIRPGSGHDLFFKLARGSYRLWSPSSDPAPLYPLSDPPPPGELDDQGDIEESEASSEFAAEKDLQKYLLENLNSLEPGIRLYEEEGMTGFEYPAGGRFIDILAVDRDENFVVIELKVSRGYDRVIGQLLRYMAWVERNLADKRKVRGIIVARSISEDLRLATSRIKDVNLFEYRIKFEIERITSN